MTKTELVAFENEKERARLAAAKAKTASAYGGGDDDDEKAKKAAAAREREEKAKKAAAAVAAASASEDEEKKRSEQQSPEEVAAAALAEKTAAHNARLAAVAESEMEVRERNATTRLLQHERATLLAKIDKTVTTFDQAVSDLRQEKFRLDADLKSTDLKLLTLYQELLMLKQFEQTESSLNAKMAKSKHDKAQVVAEITECQEKLQARYDPFWDDHFKTFLNCEHAISYLNCGVEFVILQSG